MSKNNYDVIIIGNGSIACSIAFELIKLKSKKTKICLIGPKNREGSASLAAGAMLNIFAELEYDSLDNKFGRKKFEMLLKSKSLWPNFVKKLNSKINNKDKIKIRKGTIILNNSSADKLDDENFFAIETGLKKFKENYEKVENKLIDGYAPSEKNRSLNSIFIPDENFIVSSKSLLHGYDTFFSKEKNIFVNDVSAKKINFKKNSLKEIIDLNGDKFYSKNIVIAAGAYSKYFINQIKEVNKKIPDLFFGSGSAFISKNVNTPTPKHVVRTPNRGMACGLHLVPFGNKDIYVGATNRISHVPINKPILSSFLSLQNSLIKEININFNNIRIDKVCIGHRPTTADTFPILGPLSVDGIWVASGTKRDGLTLSPLIGKGIANMILNNNKKNNLIPKEFYPERKLIKTMSVNQGIEKSVKHMLSAAYQHELEFPRVDFENSVREMIYKNIKNDYKKCKLNHGVPPEMLNMYKYKRVKNFK